MAQRITWLDKILNVASSLPIIKTWGFADANQVKSVVNSHADDIEALQNAPSNGDMTKSVYDTNDSGVVDNSEKVNGLTVETAVPTNAEFTDTTEYDIYDTKANILLLDPSLYAGQRAWATDEFSEYKPIQAVDSITGAAFWQRTTPYYDEISDLWIFPTDARGQTLEVGRNFLIDIINDDAVAITESVPQVVIAEGSITESNFSNVVRINASDMFDGGALMVTTTNIDANGGKGIASTNGYIGNVDASGGAENWQVRDTLYIHPSIRGCMTNVKPNSNVYVVGYVANNDAINGSIYVDVVRLQLTNPTAPKLGTTDVNLTGDTVILPTGTYYILNTDNEGTVADASVTATVTDNSKAAFNQNFITEIFPIDNSLIAAKRTGLFEISHNSSGGQEKVYAQLYNADADGNVIASGLGNSGELGDYIIELDTRLMDNPANSDFPELLDGTLANDFPLLAGNRLLMVLVGEKIGSAGGNKTITVKFGTNRISHLDSFSDVTTTDVINTTLHEGTTASDVMNLSIQQGGAWGTNLDSNGKHKLGGLYNDQDYLGYALIPTNDRLAPKKIGSELLSIDDVNTKLSSNGLLSFTQEITFTKDGYSSGNVLEIKIPNFTSGYKVDVSVIDQNGVSLSYNNLTPISSNWFVIDGLSSSIFRIGETINIRLDVQKTISQTYTDEWVSIIAGTTIIQQFALDSFSAPTTLIVNNTNFSNIDVRANFVNTSIGDVIEINENNDLGRFLKLEVTTVDVSNPNQITYGVNVVNKGLDIRTGQLCDIDFVSMVVGLSNYYEESGYYTSNPIDFGTITTSITLGGVLQPQTDSGIGIRFTFQEVYISDEWQIIYLPSNIGNNVTTKPIIQLPEFIDVELNKTTQLFYQAMVKNVDYDKYNFVTLSNIPTEIKSLKRYAEITPLTVGNRNVTVHIVDDNSNSISSATTTLRVTEGINQPTVMTNSWFFGDSLTANPAWTTEANRMLTGTGGTPAGKGYGNITFHVEGNSGKQWNWYVTDEASPIVYSGVVDFEQYRIDNALNVPTVVYILLTWNGMGQNRTDDEWDIWDDDVYTFIDELKLAFPLVDIVLMSPNMPDTNGGLGITYQALSLDYYNNEQVLKIECLRQSQIYERISNEVGYEHVDFIQCAVQFDSVYNMSITLKDVNTRNSTAQEPTGSNGLHPDTIGYYQIADSQHPHFLSKYCQGVINGYKIVFTSTDSTYIKTPIQDFSVGDFTIDITMTVRISKTQTLMLNSNINGGNVFLYTAGRIGYRPHGESTTISPTSLFPETGKYKLTITKSGTDMLFYVDDSLVWTLPTSGGGFYLEQVAGHDLATADAFCDIDVHSMNINGEILNIDEGTGTTTTGNSGTVFTLNSNAVVEDMWATDV